MKLANVDGVVLASCRMCRRQARAELDFWIRVRHELGIPTLFVEVSPADPRDYSKIETERKIDTFLEQVMAMKERKGRSA